MNYSVVIVSYHSFHLIENLIKSFDQSYNIIVIENSRDFELKKKIEEKYSNVNIVIPETNIGFGPGINLGLKLSKNQFVLCLVADVEISKEAVNDLSKCLDDFQNFAIISPTFFNEDNYKNYEIYSEKKESIKLNFSKFGLKEVDRVDGAAFIVNKSKFENIGFMDEKFFFYFEQEDLCLRINKNKEKIYVCDKIKFSHKGLASSHSSVIKKVQLVRNWHYSWGKFYFYKKHYGYYVGIRKTLPNFIRSLRLVIINYLKHKPEEVLLHKAILKGLINSYLLKKSFYR